MGFNFSIAMCILMTFCWLYAGTTHHHFAHDDDIGMPAEQYSSFRCSGASEKNIEKWFGRGCIFHDVCTRSQPHVGSSRHQWDAEFQYYKENMAHPLLFDHQYGYLSNFSVDGKPFVYMTPRPTDSEGIDAANFTPTVVQSPIPEHSVHTKGVYIIWEHRIGDDNLGHLVWEDVFWMWLSLQTFNVAKRPVQVLNVGKACDGLCAKLADGFIAPLFGLPVLTWDEGLMNLNHKLHQRHGSHPVLERTAEEKEPSEIPSAAPNLCFQTVLVGGYEAYLAGYYEMPHGVETSLYAFRAEVLRAHGFEPKTVPDSHSIVLVRKTSSNKMSLRNIVNLEEVEQFLHKTYPDIPVTVVDWTKMSLTEQFRVLLSTTVIISPAGGISMMLPFLPFGAHAIITDFHQRIEDEGTKVKKDVSMSMEDNFWSHWPHIKNDYYLVDSPEQYVFDDPSKCPDGIDGRDCDTRESARVIIHVQTLQRLVDGALGDMKKVMHFGAEFRFRKLRGHQSP